MLRLVMLMLFILRRFLKPNHVKTEIKNNWRVRQISSVSKLCTCWAIEAKVLKLAFSLSITTNSYQELQELLKKKYKILLEVNPQFNTRTNVINNLARDPSLYTILSDWYITENLSAYTNNQSIENRSDSEEVFQ
ncbi:15422_t:CDS:2 [Cetraspora pellucida]|uniref:15422_t:CDS:1 n=1 Tax=Cetraspora pellucida TaxID=1433469 RepID=A0A9N9NDF5_9GLOM|nr:15422_t:CDS:2 [Cetraspora pellucida]